ncbi:MAG: hypothetical protein VW311_01765 [Gammaproteobacteria bacterium]
MLNIPPLLIVAYVAVAALVGFIGRNRAAGFAGNFMLSLLLTPIIMSLVLMLGTPRRAPRPEKAK